MGIRADDLSDEEISKIVRAVEESILKALTRERMVDADVVFSIELGKLPGVLQVKLDVDVRDRALGPRGANEKAARLLKVLKEEIERELARNLNKVEEELGDT
uniref:DUF3194 domain-containing protein n=1 Tax=Fervidicoccus fontis TaxID=683846 RepID=A0A7J3ZL92_9CREN